MEGGTSVTVNILFPYGPSPELIDSIKYFYGDSETVPEDAATLTERHRILDWGSAGTGAGQFDAPADVAVDSLDNVYVADTGNNRVQKFDKYRGNPVTLTTRQNDPLASPQGICVTESVTEVGTVYIVYIADKNNHRIISYNWSQAISSHDWDSGTALGTGLPIDVAVETVDGVTYVYVIEQGSNSVLRIRKDDLTQTAINGPANPAMSPSRIALYGETLYVTDTANNTVQKFTRNGGVFAYAESCGTPGTDEGELNSPTGICVYTDGRIFVCDKGNHRIQRFSAAGTFEVAWGDATMFNFTGGAGIAVGPDGCIFVTDTGRNRIRRFQADNSLTFYGMFDGAETEVKITKVNGDPVDPATMTGFDVDDWGTIDADVSSAFHGSPYLHFGTRLTKLAGTRCFRTEWSVTNTAQDAPQEIWAASGISRTKSLQSQSYIPFTVRVQGAANSSSLALSIADSDFELEQCDSCYYPKSSSKAMGLALTTAILLGTEQTERESSTRPIAARCTKGTGGTIAQKSANGLKISFCFDEACTEVLDDWPENIAMGQLRSPKYYLPGTNHIYVRIDGVSPTANPADYSVEIGGYVAGTGSYWREPTHRAIESVGTGECTFWRTTLPITISRSVLQGDILLLDEDELRATLHRMGTTTHAASSSVMVDVGELTALEGWDFGIGDQVAELELGWAFTASKEAFQNSPFFWAENANQEMTTTYYWPDSAYSATTSRKVRGVKELFLDAGGNSAADFILYTGHGLYGPNFMNVSTLDSRYLDPSHHWRETFADGECTRRVGVDSFSIIEELHFLPDMSRLRQSWGREVEWVFLQACDIFARDEEGYNDAVVNAWSKIFADTQIHGICGTIGNTSTLLASSRWGSFRDALVDGVRVLAWETALGSAKWAILYRTANSNDMMYVPGELRTLSPDSRSTDLTYVWFPGGTMSREIGGFPRELAARNQNGAFPGAKAAKVPCAFYSIDTQEADVQRIGTPFIDSRATATVTSSGEVQLSLDGCGQAFSARDADSARRFFAQLVHADPEQVESLGSSPIRKVNFQAGNFAGTSNAEDMGSVYSFGRTKFIRKVRYVWHEIRMNCEEYRSLQVSAQLKTPQDAVELAIQHVFLIFPGVSRDDLKLTACAEELLVDGEALRAVMTCEFNGKFPVYIDLAKGMVWNMEWR